MKATSSYNYFEKTLTKLCLKNIHSFSNVCQYKRKCVYSRFRKKRAFHKSSFFWRNRVYYGFAFAFDKTEKSS